MFHPFAQKLSVDVYSPNLAHQEGSRLNHRQFFGHWLSGVNSLGGQILAFPIDRTTPGWRYSAAGEDRPLTDVNVIASICALNLRINFAVLEQCLLQRRVLYNAK